MSGAIKKVEIVLEGVPMSLADFLTINNQQFRVFMIGPMSFDDTGIAKIRLVPSRGVIEVQEGAEDD